MKILNFKLNINKQKVLFFLLIFKKVYNTLVFTKKEITFKFITQWVIMVQTQDCSGENLINFIAKKEQLKKWNKINSFKGYWTY